MPVNSMNTGTDYSFKYYFNGALTELGDVQDIVVDQLNHNIASHPYNAPPRFGYVPDGYKISFTVTRTDSDLEEFFIALEQNFNAGLVYNAGVLQEAITNPDGTISTYQYTGFVCSMPKRGNVSHDRAVTYSIEGMASSKVKINS